MSANTNFGTWAPVPGYVGIYEASTLGYIRSLDRWIRRSDGHWRFLRGQIMKQNSSRGYPQVALSAQGVRRRWLVHRLVLITFKGQCPPHMQACHGDDVRTNNKLENLRWDYPSQNSLDAVRNGRHWNANKSACKRGHRFDRENTYVNPGSGARQCRTCMRDLIEFRRAEHHRVAACMSGSATDGAATTLEIIPSTPTASEVGDDRYGAVSRAEHAGLDEHHFFATAMN